MTDAEGPFELIEPLPTVERPRLLMALQPWIDVGSVGTMALGFLEQLWGAQDVGKLRRPGVFYDFSRYRPMLFRREGERHVAVPNTFLRHARTPAGDDWLFLHALEPHSHGEDYVDGVMGLIRRFGVRQYTLTGSMYGPVPHTARPSPAAARRMMLCAISCTAPRQRAATRVHHDTRHSSTDGISAWGGNRKHYRPAPGLHPAGTRLLRALSLSRLSRVYSSVWISSLCGKTAIASARRWRNRSHKIPAPGNGGGTREGLRLRDA
jgi:hypothetical protein